MADKPVFPKGIFTFAKNPKSPEFVLGTAVITIDDLVQWVNDNPQYITQYNQKDQLRLNILRDKSDPNRVNFVVDTYKKSS